MLDQSYLKTEGGRAEIKARSLPLSRSARNLLLVIDAARNARQWLGLVQGATEADLALLLSHELIAVSAATTAAAAPLTAQQRLRAAFGEPAALDYQQLSALLNGQATKQLGLVKGYGFALDVEKCAGLSELQQLALDFVERVQQSKGAEAAATLRQALGLKR
jgi:ATP phosphoribosyltransferase regulatory subunit HisZ